MKSTFILIDSSKNYRLGCGGVCGKNWFALQWDPFFFQLYNPSINYLELYAVTVGVLLWMKNYKNKRVVLFCDNMSVVYMINSTSSSCKNCMILIRIIVLFSLIYNVRVYAKHVRGVKNKLADWLSRAKFNKFMQATKGKNFNKKPEEIPQELWPMEKVWSETCKLFD